MLWDTFSPDSVNILSVPHCCAHVQRYDYQPWWESFCIHDTLSLLCSSFSIIIYFVMFPATFGDQNREPDAMAYPDHNVRPRNAPSGPFQQMPVPPPPVVRQPPGFEYVSVYIADILRAWYNPHADPLLVSYAIPLPLESPGPTIDDIKWDIAQLLTSEYNQYVSAKCLQMFDNRNVHVPYTVSLREFLTGVSIRDEWSLCFYDQQARIIRSNPPTTTPLYGETCRAILHLRPSWRSQFHYPHLIFGSLGVKIWRAVPVSFNSLCRSFYDSIFHWDRFPFPFSVFFSTGSHFRFQHFTHTRHVFDVLSILFLVQGPCVLSV